MMKVIVVGSATNTINENMPIQKNNFCKMGGPKKGQ